MNTALGSEYNENDEAGRKKKKKRLVGLHPRLLDIWIHIISFLQLFCKFEPNGSQDKDKGKEEKKKKNKEERERLPGSRG